MNAFAPLRVSQAFLPSVRQGRHRKIVVVSTSLGSVCGAMNWGDGIQGDTMHYPISKAAVNMGMTIFAAQVAEEDIRVGLLAPGGVLTDMLRQSRPDTTGAIPREEAVRGMIALIETHDASARLVDLDGNAAGC